MLNFGLVGAAGHIAEKHLQAIKRTGNLLVCAADPHDSMERLDRYFQDVHYFPEIERFDRFLQKQSYGPKSESIGWVSICSPNYLHDAHIRMALRSGANVICEKPVVINPWNLDALKLLEEEHTCRVYTVLQHRFDPELLSLKQRIENHTTDRKLAVNLNYYATRGSWYLNSWQGRDEQSGGLIISIGVLLFDLLVWMFGPPESAAIDYRNSLAAGGVLNQERACSRWSITMNADDFPEELLEKGITSAWSFEIDGVLYPISGGLLNLHDVVYRQTLQGNGVTLEDARPALELVYQLRNSQIGSELIDLQHW